MVKIISVVVFILCIVSGYGQLLDMFFPRIAKATRYVADEVVSLPLVQSAIETTGNFVSGTLNMFSDVPAGLASVIGVDNIPMLIPSNVIGLSDKIVSEYNAGLGNEDAAMDVGDMIVKYSYPLEEHEVVTEDGYILRLLRIPGNGSVVFLMHGLIGSADDYVLGGPDNSLSYLLANEGYDVWLGNARGNKHSRRHVMMDPIEPQFWDFSWHEIGCYDLPAMINHVLKETGQSKIKYIGHSQGTTSFFVMASQRPEMNDKISLMIALSPVAYMSNVKSPIVRLQAPFVRLIYGSARSLGVHEFFPDKPVVRLIKKVMCGTGPLTEIFCSNIIWLICGFDIAQTNITNLPVLYGHMPSGASAKQFAHYGQGVMSGEFKQFDYGSYGNLERYGSEVPPEYPLEDIKVPVSLFYSEDDWLAHPIDVDKLYNRLGNAVDIYKVPYRPFNHIDFLLAKDLKPLIYYRMRKLLQYF